MHTYSRLLLAAVVLLIAGLAWAQERMPGWLGIEMQDITKEEADKLGWEAPRGAKVVRPVDGSPAAAAGLEPGDVIATLDGFDVENITGFTKALSAKGAGSSVRLRLMRAGRERTVTVTLAARPWSLAAGGEKVPQFMLDSGGHMANVVDLAFTPDGKQIVSGSNDKTVRVWNVETGKTVRMIRGEAAPGLWGSIYAMALSPDGRWLATGGYFHESDFAVGAAVRLYDFASGKLEALLKGHDEVVGTLAFSPDSKRLVSGSFDKTAIIWDLATRQQLLRLSGHSGRINAAAFTSDGGRVVTGSEDGTLRLWSASDAKLIAEMTEHKLILQRDFKDSGVSAVVRSLAVAPTDHLIASGTDHGNVLLWDDRTGVFLRQLTTPDAYPVGALDFSRDGQWLLATGSVRGCQVFEVATGQLRFEKKSSDDDRAACGSGGAFSPDAGLMAAGNNEAVNLADPRTGNLVNRLRGLGASVLAVGFGKDSTSVAWGSVPGPGLGEAELTHRLVLPANGRPLGAIEELSARSNASSLPAPVESYVRTRREHGQWSVRPKQDYQVLFGANAFDIFKDGKLEAQIKLSGAPARYDAPVAFTPDEQTLLVGHVVRIEAYNLSGRPLGEFAGHGGIVRDLAPSPDGRLLVSGGSDQTVRLWNLKTRELIVSLFRGSDSEWVMWTPQGYYTSSPGADKIVGWQINKGPEQTPDYVGADQLRQHLHRPDIVEKAIILASAEEAVRQAPGTSLKLADLLARPVPRFRIVSPLTGSAQRGGRASVQIVIEDTPDPVRLVRVHVNGRQVEEQTPEVGSGGFGAGERVLDVPLGQGRNDVRIALTNAIGEKVETLVLNHEGNGALDKRGTLHILAIGVNEYRGLGNTCSGAACDLRYSVADARKMAEAIEQRLGPGHSRVVKRLLVNGGDAGDAPTAVNIIDAVELLRHAKETDTVVLFIAGHGVNEGPDYRFLPTNAERTQAEGAGWSLRGSTVVPWQVLQSAVEAAKGRRLLFVDTCHSGNAYNQRLGNAAYHANIIAYTAARFDQEAMEDPGLGHGLFTYAVVEGLKGNGALGTKRRISTKDLAVYVVSRVGALAKAMNGDQEPQYFRGRDADDYVLAQW